MAGSRSGRRYASENRAHFFVPFASSVEVVDRIWERDNNTNRTMDSDL